MNELNLSKAFLRKSIFAFYIEKIELCGISNGKSLARLLYLLKCMYLAKKTQQAGIATEKYLRLKMVKSQARFAGLQCGLEEGSLLKLEIL
uniref:Uncharacterized protein n=1 Tax=Romanomermis culicivorax TaxID=13658 RepID=A0A915HFY5_ROMCU